MAPRISLWCNFQANLPNSVSSEAVIAILCCQAIQYSRCTQLVPFPISWLGLLSCHLLKNALGYLICFFQDVGFFIGSLIFFYMSVKRSHQSDQYPERLYVISNVSDIYNRFFKSRAIAKIRVRTFSLASDLPFEQKIEMICIFQ